jgi:hypothetical protein
MTRKNDMTLLLQEQILVVESLDFEYECPNCLQQFKIDRSNEVKTKDRGVGKTYPAPSPSTSG